MKDRKIISSGNGVPPGKVCAWVTGDDKKMIFGVVQYDTLDEALADAGSLLLESGGRSVIINHKEPDESFLHVYELKKIASWAKQEPADWSWINPVNWFKKTKETS